MKYLDGSAAADRLMAGQIELCAQLAEQGGVPRLDVVMGLGEASLMDEARNYAVAKQKYADRIGATVIAHERPAFELQALIGALNKVDSPADAIVLVMPVPDLAPDATTDLCNSIKPAKDVDGLGVNAWYRPAAPRAVLALLDACDVDITQGQVLLIGNGRTVGKPLVEMLKERSVTPRIIHEDTPKDEVPKAVRHADIVISAAGVQVIEPDMIRDNHVVVGVGLRDLQPAIYDLSSTRFLVSPPAGKGVGVGTLTVLKLFESFLDAARERTLPAA